MSDSTLTLTTTVALHFDAFVPMTSQDVMNLVTEGFCPCDVGVCGPCDRRPDLCFRAEEAGEPVALLLLWGDARVHVLNGAFAWDVNDTNEVCTHG